MNDKIVIKGAKEHNLKNINLEIPRDKLVVITGLSGSGAVQFLGQGGAGKSGCPGLPGTPQPEWRI